MLADGNCDEQAILESLSNYYFAHNESFGGLTITPENERRFLEFREDAIRYYDED